jgi:hypothetical protein
LCVCVYRKYNTPRLYDYTNVEEYRFCGRMCIPLTSEIARVINVIIRLLLVSCGSRKHFVCNHRTYTENIMEDLCHTTTENVPSQYSRRQTLDWVVKQWVEWRQIREFLVTPVPCFPWNRFILEINRSYGSESKTSIK